MRMRRNEHAAGVCLLHASLSRFYLILELDGFGRLWTLPASICSSEQDDGKTGR